MVTEMENIILGNNAQFLKYPFSDFVDAQVKLAVRSVDLTAGTPHIYIDPYEIIDSVDVKGQLKRAEITVNTVTPAPYRYSICSDENTILNQKTIEYYKQCIMFAKDIGAENLIITAAGACFDHEPARLMDNAVKTLDKLASFAKEQGITLLTSSVLGEESPYNESTPVMVTLSEIAEVIDKVHSQALKAYLDVEVISLIGETIPQWFEKLGDAIRLVRFTDGNYNGYRVLGEGCLPCEKFLKQIMDAGFNGPISIQIPGERYSENPQNAEKKMISYLENLMKKVV